MANKKFRAVRKKCSLTQEDLAERTGVSVRTISRLENGQQSPHPSTLRILCQELNAAPEDLGFGHSYWE